MDFNISTSDLTAVIFIAVVFTGMLIIILRQSHTAVVREAKLQMDLETVSNERDELVRRTKDFQIIRDNDLTAHHERERVGVEQMDRAAKVLNRVASESERHWIIGGDTDLLTIEEKTNLGLLSC